jgi:phage shock protein PspC (stress-responsive transcriptional regulator)
MNTHKRLYRSDDPVFAGVCGGLAEYFELDPTLIRILSVILVLAGFGLPIVAYIIAIVLMPKRSGGYPDYIDVKPAPAQAYSASAAPNGTSASVAGVATAPGGPGTAGGPGVPGTAGYASVAAAGAASAMGGRAGAGFAGAPSASAPPTGAPPTGAPTGPSPIGAAGYANPATAPQNPASANTTSGPQGVPYDAPPGGPQGGPHNAPPGPQGGPQGAPQGNPQGGQASSAWSCATPPGRAYTACNPQAYDAVNSADQAADDSPSRHRFRTGIIVGILLVSLGLLALLDTFFDISAKRFWPLILIVIGFVILCTPRKSGWSLARAGHAISIITIGFVLQLWALGIVTTLGLELTLRYLWPVLLVTAGLFVIGSATEKSVFNLFGSLLLSAALLFGIWSFGQIIGPPFNEILDAMSWSAFLASDYYPPVQDSLGLLGR